MRRHRIATVTTGLILVCGSLSGLPAAARAGDDDPSTARRILGTTLGSVDGALLARAVTLNEERTWAVSVLYLAAVGGGAGIGYAAAGNDGTLTAMGILLIPLVILNIALPATNRFDAPGAPGAARSASAAAAAAAATAAASAARAGAGSWWKRSLLGSVPQPARGGVRVTPLRIGF